mmetsp:Transcript_64485/g.115969  ORF Transcript_64485/g.115969 Transcript_64485/m.115969 type:complete len:209 (-) Transcript_64485:684-1310(-)
MASILPGGGRRPFILLLLLLFLFLLLAELHIFMCISRRRSSSVTHHNVMPATQNAVHQKSFGQHVARTASDLSDTCSGHEAVLPVLVLKVLQLSNVSRLSTLFEFKHPRAIGATRNQGVQGSAREQQDVARTLRRQRGVVLPGHAHHLSSSKGLSRPKHSHVNAPVLDVHLSAVHDDHGIANVTLPHNSHAWKQQAPLKQNTYLHEEL